MFPRVSETGAQGSSVGGSGIAPGDTNTPPVDKNNAGQAVNANASGIAGQSTGLRNSRKHQGVECSMVLYLGFCLFGTLGLISFFFFPWGNKSEQDGSKVPVRRRSKRTNGAAGQAQNNV
jgi:hypothetical protein